MTHMWNIYDRFGSMRNQLFNKTFSGPASLACLARGGGRLERKSWKVFPKVYLKVINKWGRWCGVVEWIFFVTLMRSSTLSLSSFLNLQFYLLNFSNACTTSSRVLSHHSATIKKHFHLSKLLVMFVFSISTLLQRLRLPLAVVRSFFIHSHRERHQATCHLLTSEIEVH